MQDEALYQAIDADWRTAPLDPRRRALAAFAAKLTRAPEAVVRGDLEEVRAHGLSDADLLALVEVVSYYAYANRIAQGLGVELEASRSTPPDAEER